MTEQNRIIEETVQRVRETVAPRIVIEWDPDTNEGLVTFELRDQVWENGVYIGLQPHTRLKNLGPGRSMQVDLQEVLGESFAWGDDEESCLTLMAMIKAYFSEKWEARYVLQQMAEAQEEEIELPPVS